MPGWWRSPGGRTRRPGQHLAVPGDVALIGRDERQRAAGWVAVRASWGVLLLGLVWLSAYLLTAPQFAVRSVEVTGNRLVPADRIVEAASITGQNVFLVGSRQVESACLAIRPLRSVAVTYVWPNVVKLEVVERRPFATWRTGGAAYLVSEDGVILAPAAGDGPLPVILDGDAQPVVVGGTVDGELLREAAYLAAALGPLGLNGRDLEHSRTYGLTASGENGLRVAFGRGDLPEKVATLRALLGGLAGRRVPVQFVDLRLKDRPYFR